MRYYKPYSMTLLAFQSRFVSRARTFPRISPAKSICTIPPTGEDRDVMIYMNSPLRYRGETFYQASFEPGDRGTILQVVRNPASITPYVACSLVALGLVVQFLMHLSGFARKRAQSLESAPPQRTSLDSVLARPRAMGKEVRHENSD